MDELRQTMKDMGWHQLRSPVKKKIRYEWKEPGHRNCSPRWRAKLIEKVSGRWQVSWYKETWDGRGWIPEHRVYHPNLFLAPVPAATFFALAIEGQLK